MITFERIGKDGVEETVAIRQEEEGVLAEAKIAALINSSNMGPNADRGQDFGWRLGAEHQAKLEEWKETPEMVEKVSQHTSVQVDDLMDSHFLQYMLYLERSESAPRTIESKNMDEAERDYRDRVNAARKGGNAKTETSSRVKEQEKGDGTGEATVKNQTPQTQEQPSAPRTENPEAPARAKAGAESQDGNGTPGDDLDGIDKFDKLKELAGKENVDVEGLKSKNEVREAIRTARANTSES